MKKPFLKRLDLLNSKKEEAAPDQELTFEKLNSVTRIVVTTNFNETLKTIEDPETIARVVAFIQTQHSGWLIPRDGVPILSVRLNFSAGEKRLGNFSLSKKIFTAHQLGTFWAKYPTQEESETLVKLAGLEEFPLD